MGHTFFVFLKEPDHHFLLQTQSIFGIAHLHISMTKSLQGFNFYVKQNTHIPFQTCTGTVQVNSWKTDAHALFYIHTNTSQINLTNSFFSYHLCGKGWSPLSSPPTQEGPAPSGQWPAAWCRVRTGSYTCTASAWSQHVSSHTCGRSHHCSRWWRSFPLLRWLWRSCDLRKK